MKCLISNCLAGSRAKQHCKLNRGEPEERAASEEGEKVKASAVLKAK